MKEKENEADLEESDGSNMNINETRFQINIESTTNIIRKIVRAMVDPQDRLMEDHINKIRDITLLGCILEA